MSQTSQTLPPPSAIRKVPIRETAAQAYTAVFSRFDLLVRAAALPLVLSITIEMLAWYAHATFLAFVLWLLGFVPYTLFGVAWHRLTLLGPAAASPPVVPSWTRRHWRFLGYTFAVMLLGYVASIPFSLVIGLIASAGQGAPLSDAQATLLTAAIFAAIIGLFYVTMRLSFVFPAVAVDESYQLAHAWAHTSKQGFRLLSTMALISLPMVGLLWIATAIFGPYLFPGMEAPVEPGGPPPAEPLRDAAAENLGAIFLARIAVAVISYIGMALLVTGISIAFRTATGWVPTHAGPPAPVDED